MGLLALGVALLTRGDAPRPLRSGWLPHDVYVWQRVFDAPMRDALHARLGMFRRTVVLERELTPHENGVSVALAHPPLSALAKKGGSVGLCLRVGPVSGPLGARGDVLEALSAAVAEAIARARAADLPPAELQIDFDAAESQLDDYAAWLRALRPSCGGIPLRATALPSWLDRRAFAAFAAACDGYVLQVHGRGLGHRDTPSLFAPRRARVAIERAAAFDHPFEVALPTYDHLLTVGPDGKASLHSEERLPELAAGTGVRLIGTQTREVHALLESLRQERPAALRGVIWFRLPLPGDRRNLPWPALRALVGGRSPRTELTLVLRWRREFSAELEIRNTGETAVLLPGLVELRSSAVRPLSVDALGGYTLEGRTARGVRFRRKDRAALRAVRPTESVRVGWALWSSYPGAVRASASGALPAVLR